jgi:hypothetical protein
MLYIEDGWYAEVEVISKEPHMEGKTEGVKTTLKVIRTLQESPYIKPEYHAKDGEIFSVWAAKGAGAYAGWTLTEFWGENG